MATDIYQKKVFRIGRSLAVTLPVEICTSARILEGTTVTLQLKGDSIILQPTVSTSVLLSELSTLEAETFGELLEIPTLWIDETERFNHSQFNKWLKVKSSTRDLQFENISTGRSISLNASAARSQERSKRVAICTVGGSSLWLEKHESNFKIDFSISPTVYPVRRIYKAPSEKAWNAIVKLLRESIGFDSFQLSVTEEFIEISPKETL